MRRPGHSRGGSLDASNDASYRQSLHVSDRTSTTIRPPSFTSPVSPSENPQSTRVGPSQAGMTPFPDSTPLGTPDDERTGVGEQARDRKRDSMSSLEVSYSIGRLSVINPDVPSSVDNSPINQSYPLPTSRTAQPSAPYLLRTRINRCPLLFHQVLSYWKSRNSSRSQLLCRLPMELRRLQAQQLPLRERLREKVVKNCSPPPRLLFPFRYPVPYQTVKNVPMLPRRSPPGQFLFLRPRPRRSPPNLFLCQLLYPHPPIPPLGGYPCQHHLQLMTPHFLILRSSQAHQRHTWRLLVLTLPL